MAFFYSATTRGLFDDRFNKSIPADAKAITAEHYQALRDEQTAGKLIVPGSGGLPESIDRPASTAEELFAAVLAQRRDAYRAESDNLKIEAEYDAQISGITPDYAAWMAKVSEIKERYPLPE